MYSILSKLDKIENTIQSISYRGTGNSDGKNRLLELHRQDRKGEINLKLNLKYYQ
mgnify:FL=1